MDDNIPDLDPAVLGGGDEPLALTVECYAGDVASVTVESQDGLDLCQGF
jgi:hypothetical protein